MADNNFDYSNDQDIEKRDQYRPQLPHRIVYRLCYDRSRSLNSQKHTYQLIPFMEINTGEKTLSRLSPMHKKWYGDVMKDFERNFTFTELKDAFFTEETLQNIYPWKEKYNQMYRAFRKGFPEDIQFDEEQLIYDFAVEISSDDACSLLGRVWKEEVVQKTKEQDKIEVLEGQVSDLVKLVTELLNKKE